MPIIIKELNEYATRIKNGEIGIISCDTILGLISIGSIKNHHRLATIKKRSPKKPFLWIISNKSQLNKLAQTPLSPTQKKQLQQLWPGPTTVILPKNPKVPNQLTGGKNTIAIRYTDFIPLQWLIEAIKAPILSTSINYTDQSESLDIKSIPKKIVNLVDFIWTPCQPHYKKASKIIDMTKNKKTIIRS